MRKIIFICLIALATMLKCNELDAYSTDVHRKMTENIIDLNTQSLNHYLKSSGLSEGVTESVNNREARKWFEDGSYDEDLNWGWKWKDNSLYSHFYDPLTNTSGVGDMWPSAYDWANNSNNENDWSWKKAREYLYTGLTTTVTGYGQNLRDVFLSYAFAALGHNMHLIQDMAVPAHTRGDLHGEIFGVGVPLAGKDMYEKFVKGKIRNYLGSSIFSFPPGYVSTSSGAPRYFWDTDIYDGSLVPLTDAIGIAEFTNANFFSADTIFSSRYPHPSYADTTYSTIDWLHPEVTDAEDGKLDNRIYIRKTVGLADARMASMSYISYDCIKKGYIQYSPWVLDDAVHNDYASMLIPRAVGYSAGLLNYFFRGTIDISVPSNMTQANNGFYSIIDATKPDFNLSTAKFTSVKLLAKNTTSNNEEMTNGTIQLVVKYKLVDVGVDPFQAGLLATSADFVYTVVPEKNGISSLSRTTYTELNFDLLGENAIPLRATDVYLQVVFKGTLGNEENAVAVGFKDISEPTPIDIFNNMDVICINGNWYDAGSPEAIAQVDANHNGIADTNEADVYAYDLQNIYLRFSPYNQNSPYYFASSSAHQVTVPYLYAGTPVRAAYILSDYMFNKGYYMSFVNLDPSDPWTHADLNQLWWHSAVKRQTDYSEDNEICEGNPPCYVDVYPVSSPSFPADYIPGFYTFRNATMWWGSVKILINTPYPTNSVCSYDLL